MVEPIYHFDRSESAGCALAHQS